jgi:hypothetical protein
VQEIDFRRDLEKLAREVLHAAGAGRAVRELPRPRLRERDDVLYRLHRKRGMHDEDERRYGG